MKTRTITVLLTLVLSAFLALAPVAQGSVEFNQEFKAKPGQTIELNMKQGGSLEVEGWDKDLVQVICEARINDLEDWDIEIKEAGNGLKLKAQLKDKKNQSNNFIVRLMVPDEFNIKTESAGGHITIKGVTGEFRGSSGGGGITLHNVSGEARLKTGGGKIKITDSDLDGRVSTGGGGGLVRNVTGNVKATSGGGIVSYENVRDSHGDLRGPGRMSTEGITARTIMYTTAGGTIDLAEAPEGALVKTGGGNIGIRNASRFVKANTGGGDFVVNGGILSNRHRGSSDHILVSLTSGAIRDCQVCTDAFYVGLAEWRTVRMVHLGNLSSPLFKVHSRWLIMNIVDRMANRAFLLCELSTRQA